MNDQKKKKQGRKKTPELVDVERLRKLINTKKSRQEIANAIGCDVSTITKHYNGNNPVDIEWLYKYAQYFNVSADYLLGLVEHPSVDFNKNACCSDLKITNNTYDCIKKIINSVLFQGASKSDVELFFKELESESFLIQKIIYSAKLLAYQSENNTNTNKAELEQALKNVSAVGKLLKSANHRHLTPEEEKIFIDSNNILRWDSRNLYITEQINSCGYRIQTIIIKITEQLAENFKSHYSLSDGIIAPAFSDNASNVIDIDYAMNNRADWGFTKEELNSILSYLQKGKIDNAEK